MQNSATYKVSKFLSENKMEKHGFNENTTCSESLDSRNASDYMKVDGYSDKYVFRNKANKYSVKTLK